MSDAQSHLTNFLRADIAGFVLSLLVLFIGLAALAVYLFRFRMKDRGLLWFGLFFALYGVRALSRHGITQVIFDVPHAFWSYCDSIISDVIVTPALLFVE